MKRGRRAGYTLIEMLVAVTVVSIFAALSRTHFGPRIDTTRQTAAMAQIDGFVSALATYKLDTGVYPSDEEGLHALWERPASVQNWQGPYLHKKIAPDPWGHAYVYHRTGPHEGMPEVISLGADGRPGGSGMDADIVSWKGKP